MNLKQYIDSQTFAHRHSLPGHVHVHQQTGLSRRHFLRAGLGAAVASMGLPRVAWAARPRVLAAQTGGMPNPIPYTTDAGDLGTFHLYLPTPAMAPAGDPTIEDGAGDPSTITDFDGTVGVFEPLGGTGLATNADGTAAEMYWAADVRFMDGKYMDVDGKEQEGTFAFI